ncbi:MAG: SdpI family protein [Ruminococcaceae bacterium]|nr:SdpI family protein [Oscillospiraceae bacterium]
MNALTAATNELGLDSLLPDFSTFMGWIELLLRIAVMVGPLLLLGFGLVYLLSPPKEANYGLGFRCWWGMASLDAWKFTQRIAGMVWSGLGAVLTIVMAIVCITFRAVEPMEMAHRAGICLIWELVLVALACLAINIVVMVVFDKDGFRRKEVVE